MSGCAEHNYSYIPLMPNELAFTNGGQFKAGGTVSFNHIEGQAAYSPINHVSLLASGFRGTDKQWSSEYGASGYYGFNIGRRKVFFSAGCTFGEGEVRGEVKTGIPSYNSTFREYEYINGYYRSTNFQTALYFHYDNNPKQVLGFVFKHSMVNYNYLIKDYLIKSSDYTLYRFAGLNEHNLMISGDYLAFFGHIEPLEIPFYFNWQIGIKPISKVAEFIENNHTSNPPADRIALNLAVGINLDFY